jgi:uncharacterized protein YqjF (DUF2071 family)
MIDLEAAMRQARSLEHTEHRPWPIAPRGWTMGQTWEDLLFAHWRVPLDVVRPHVPAALEVEQHDGTAWVGITPFRLTNLRARGLPPLPGVSSFLELNVRTYVSVEEKPGIWFFSLDAASRLFVEGGKKLYRLPYFHAEMSCVRTGDQVQYESARPGAAFSGGYRGDGPLFQAEPGSLEAFLTERYCLYTEDGVRLYRAEIHHPPWDLQHGEAHVDLNTMAPVGLGDETPHVLFSPRQDVVVWPLRELDAA